MFEKLANLTSSAPQELTSSDIEKIRVLLSAAGPIPTAVLYNNGKTLGELIPSSAVAVTTDFSMSLMLMGG